MAAWRIIVGDQYGNTLTNVSPIAIGRQYVGTLNRPAMFTFKVPSHDARVATMHTDGYPYVGEDRTVRAYRQEAKADGSIGWVPRFAGYIWQVTDEGGDSDQWTTCVCFDPLQLLGRRFARVMSFSGSVDLGIFITQSPGGNGEVNAGPYLSFGLQTVGDQSIGNAVFTPQAGTDIARGLLNCTNNTDGFTGLLDYYPSSFWQGSAVLPDGHPTPPRDGVPGLYPTGYTVGDPAIVLPPRSPAVGPTYDHTPVGQAIIDLTATYNSFDLEVIPLDIGAQYAGYTQGGIVISDYPTIDGIGRHMLGRMAIFQALGQLRFYAPSRGSNQTGVVFAWQAPPYTAKRISRVTDREQLVNNAFGVGNSIYAQATAAASLKRFGASMGEVSYPDVADATTLSSLTSEAVLLGGVGAPAYTVTPMPGKTALPFDSFNLGDSVTVVAGSKLRGGFSNAQRVYGFTLDILDDSATEVLSSLTTSPLV